MIHSKILNYIHLVWRTKYGQRVLTFEVRGHLAKHLLYQAGKVKIPFLSLNVQPEHVHGLINLPSSECLADFVQKIKGESAYWLNHEILNYGKTGGSFSWQRGYGAFSVNPSDINKVKTYIKNQDNHHKINSFRNEYESLLTTWQFEKVR